MTIVSLRGTSGSGKSTVVHQILQRWPHELLDCDAKGRPRNYRVTLPNGESLYIIGRYTTQCGGCDGIQPYSDIVKRIAKYAPKGHVLFEGLLISSGYGSIGKFSERYREDFVFAFMDTPLKVCLQRIQKRRKAKGNTKPLNPYNTELKHKVMWKSVKVIGDLGRRCVIIDHQKAFSQVMKLYGIRVRMPK